MARWMKFYTPWATRSRTVRRCWPSVPRPEENTLHILLYRPDGDTGPWADEFARHLPQAECVTWREGVRLPRCDYAVIWAPPEAMLRDLAEVKAVFLMGAGADAILKHAGTLPAHVPIVRLGDAGMGVQMGDYVTHAVL